ncbi:cytochrome P450 [Dendrothele bispora CBS 962.96]|uniref:Cytochrome P450 n=1 Tax=Dendrothele bispora (strain CBS 962.96) TaxID=1314807 RepID=A0A4S8MN00_DENBC|nr:cytochrome P450 [Dendrothele bispora CBS 962.96]
MPKERDWETFAKWGDQYGALVSVTALGQVLVFTNSVSVAMDMFDNQSAIYSDRPVFPMLGELMGWKYSMGFIRYGQRWRSIRRLSHQLLGTPSKVKVFHGQVEVETHKFLKRVLGEPERLKDHLRKTAGAIILRMSYGYEVQEGPDPLVDLANRATEQASQALVPGRFLVNFVPALLHIPEWFPGAGFKKIAKEWGASLNDTVERPYKFVRDQIAAGTAEVSFVSKLVEGKQLDDEEEFAVKWAAQSFYAAGSDTTVGAVYGFFKMMVLYPEVQAKAQAEIDRVVGPNRLPTIADIDQLPYVNALTKETFRIHTVVPMGVPHSASEDSVYNGYFIPKGAQVFANLWRMTHDPKTYHDPMKFNPERFLGPKPELDPTDLMFGFGRRICAGRHLAEISVFISCAMVLATFNVNKCYDANGNPLEPDLGTTPGGVSHPTDFKFSITPRSENAIALIRGELSC